MVLTTCDNFQTLKDIKNSLNNVLLKTDIKNSKGLI
jgi:hypothetical protein